MSKKKLKNICCWSQGDGREFNCKKFEKKKMLNCLQLTKVKLILINQKKSFSVFKNISLIKNIYRRGKSWWYLCK